MKTKKPIHCFKAGRHVTMAGESIEFGEADVAAIAASYNPKLHKAPLVIGHPKEDGPAMGGVAALKVGPRGLFAEPDEVDVAFARQVGPRGLNAVSCKFFRPEAANNPAPGSWYLRHIGFLGAQNPAVQGLDGPEFAAEDDGCVCFQEAVEFGDWDDRTIAATFRSLRDWLLVKFGPEEADRALPPWNVDSLQESAAQPEQEDETTAPAFSESQTQPAKETVVTPEEKARIEAENAKLKQQLAERDAREKAAKQKAVHDGNVEFAESLIGKEKLKPKHKDAVVAMLDALAAPGANGKEVEFGAGDEAQPLAEVMKGFLSDQAKVVEFGEFATKDRATGAVKINPLLADAEARAGK